ncbi:hypothetical protein [Shewanella waksmanii]|uniref:hypothetical protein n=1 Tax=Shewanella waksmanii TaxID=213783 RepID=UPI003734D7E7
MTDIIPTKQLSSYSIAALLHQWGITPRVESAVKLDFSFERYRFSCVLEQQVLLVHFGDVVFRQRSDIALIELQSELATLNKHFNNSFVCHSAFHTKKHEIGVELIYALPIVAGLVVDQLHFALKHFLNGCVDILNTLKQRDYLTLVHYLLDENPTHATAEAALNRQSRGTHCYSGSDSVKTPALAAAAAASNVVMPNRVCNDSNTKLNGDDYYDGNDVADGGGLESTESWQESNTMLDTMHSEFSAEMGHDGDDN